MKKFQSNKNYLNLLFKNFLINNKNFFYYKEFY